MIIIIIQHDRGVKVIVVITLQYINLTTQHIQQLKLTEYYMSTIFQSTK